MPAALAEYDVVWMRLAHRIDRDLLASASRCRILATPVTGLDRIDLEACAERGIQVISLRGESEFFAQRAGNRGTDPRHHAGLVASDCACGRFGADRPVRIGTRFRGQELFAKTAGIVGVGRLGSLVAGYFRGLGMEVIGYDPRPDFPHECQHIENLSELLERADVVSIHAAYTPATRHLIGARQFARCKPEAILVNTARGGIVDEQALLAALQNGQIAGAALDVLDAEPEVGPDHPLVAYARTHDNLLIVPHLGGNTRESFEKTEYFLAGRVVQAIGRLACA